MNFFLPGPRLHVFIFCRHQQARLNVFFFLPRNWCFVSSHLHPCPFLLPSMFFILTQELGKRREREKGGKKNQMTFSLSAHGTWEKMEEIAKKEAWPLAGRKMRGEKTTFDTVSVCVCSKSRRITFVQRMFSSSGSMSTIQWWYLSTSVSLKIRMTLS